jgi:hypothetical protein
MDQVVEYGQYALTALGGVIVILAVVAPLTKSDIDNRALDFLRKVVELGGKLVGHKPRA